jgi:hypothetical protein
MGDEESLEKPESGGIAFKEGFAKFVKPASPQKPYLYMTRMKKKLQTPTSKLQRNSKS